MRWLMPALLIFSLCVNPVNAVEPPVTHSIAGDDGGSILEYIARYVVWQKNGDSVRIEGECDSACTIVLGVVDTSRICATRNAEFGFHSASLAYANGSIEYSADATRLLWWFYEDRVKRVIVRHGWKGPSFHPKLLMIDALEFVRPCTWEDYHG